MGAQLVTPPVPRHPLHLEVNDRPGEGDVGQLGAAVDEEVHLRSTGLLGIAVEPRIVVHRQTQLRRVALETTEIVWDGVGAPSKLVMCATTVGFAGVAP